jgi:hypothetical protein
MNDSGLAVGTTPRRRTATTITPTTSTPTPTSGHGPRLEQRHRGRRQQSTPSMTRTGSARRRSTASATPAIRSASTPINSVSDPGDQVGVYTDSAKHRRDAEDSAAPNARRSGRAAASGRRARRLGGGNVPRDGFRVPKARFPLAGGGKLGFAGFACTEGTKSPFQPSPGRGR